MAMIKGNGRPEAKMMSLMKGNDRSLVIIFS